MRNFNELSVLYCHCRVSKQRTCRLSNAIKLLSHILLLTVVLSNIAAQGGAANVTSTNSQSNGDSNYTISVLPLSPPLEKRDGLTDKTKYTIIGSVCGFTAAVVSVLLIVACFRCHKSFQRNQKGDSSDQEMARKMSQITNPGDRKLAQSAQMFHFQHQKQQIIALENAKQNGVAKSYTLSDEELEEDDNVYECPGLATLQGAGSLEVKNPMFTTPMNGSVPSTPPASATVINELH